jgi:anaerobic ribonucleoside-triphosphate reductase activating protein
MRATLELAHVVPISAAEGPHERFAVWVQGCSLGCPGCCNPELFERGRGRAIAVDELLEQVLAAAHVHAIEGVSVLGGEPLEQLPGLIDLCTGVQRAGLGVIVFTGFTLAQARERAGFAALWAVIDTLIDGPFVAREPEPAPRAGGRRFIGSRNQVLHHRSDRYADPRLWLGPGDPVELRISPDGRMSVHGAPSVARSLVRQLGRDAGLLGPQRPSE